MKDRIVFFLLGALVATVAYFVGDMDKAGAQSGSHVFDGDVVINGYLSITGGKFMVHDQPDTTSLDEKRSYIAITTLGKAASIILQSGPAVRGQNPATITLSAGETLANKQHSQIGLFGDYEKRIYAFSSYAGIDKIR